MSQDKYTKIIVQGLYAGVWAGGRFPNALQRTDNPRRGQVYYGLPAHGVLIRPTQ